VPATDGNEEKEEVGRREEGEERGSREGIAGRWEGGREGSTAGTQI